MIIKVKNLSDYYVVVKSGNYFSNEYLMSPCFMQSPALDAQELDSRNLERQRSAVLREWTLELDSLEWNPGSVTYYAMLGSYCASVSPSGKWG